MVALTPITSQTSDTNSATYEFASVAIGDADAARRVVVGVLGRRVGALECTAVTIGGVSASRLTRANPGGGTQTDVTLWEAVVPTGTTATIAATFDAESVRCAVAGAYGLVATAADVGTSAGADATRADTINVPDDGAVFAFVGDGGPASGYTWTGATEYVDAVVESNSRYSAAIDNDLAEETGRTVQSVAGGTPNQNGMVCASFAPAAVNASAAPDAGALALTGAAPTVAASAAVTPDVAALTLTGQAPTAIASVSAAPARGVLSITGYAPTAAATSQSLDIVTTGAGAGKRRNERKRPAPIVIDDAFMARVAEAEREAAAARADPGAALIALYGEARATPAPDAIEAASDAVALRVLDPAAALIGPSVAAQALEAISALIEAANERFARAAIAERAKRIEAVLAQLAAQAAQIRDDEEAWMLICAA